MASPPPLPGAPPGLRLRAPCHVPRAHVQVVAPRTEHRGPEHTRTGRYQDKVSGNTSMAAEGITRHGAIYATCPARARLCAISSTSFGATWIACGPVTAAGSSPDRTMRTTVR